MKNILVPILFGFLVIIFLHSILWTQEYPKIYEEVSVQWWVVPVYAIGEKGKVATDLRSGDIEVYLNHKRVESFTLIKKEFQIVETQKDKSEKREGTFIARKKLVFLIFDSALTHVNLMGKAKKIAALILARPDETTQYVVLTIEPYGGLTYLIGPEASRKEILRTVSRKVHGKKNEFAGNKYLNSENIRYAGPPPHPVTSLLKPAIDQLNPEDMKNRDKLDFADMKRIVASFQSSLQTLGIILSSFQESGKVVYLFSSGIPLKMFENTKKYELESEGMIQEIEMTSPDILLYRSLQSLAATLNRNGALLFVVNPGGTRIGSTDPESGEISLRLLADDGGGKYYAGTEEEVANDVTTMERAYYEIYFPDAPELKGPEFDFEVKCRNPGVSMFSLKRLARGKAYSEMSSIEREVLMLDIVQHGYYSQIKLKTIPYILNQKIDAQCQPVFPVHLPAEFIGKELDLYKIWINREKNDVRMEMEYFTSKTAETEIHIKSRKGYGFNMVLFNPKSNSAIVGFQSKPL